MSALPAVTAFLSPLPSRATRSPTLLTLLALVSWILLPAAARPVMDASAQSLPSAHSKHAAQIDEAPQPNEAAQDEGTGLRVYPDPSPVSPLDSSSVLPPSRDAFMMRLTGDWTIDGGLPSKAFLISLQGLANRGAPRLYFIYPPDWTYTFTESVYEYYQETHNISFTEISTPEDALARFHEQAEGYVIWDPSVRTSLMVAFTVAGLEDAIVVTEDQVPLARQHGLSEVADFRGQFTGQTDYEIFSWAWDAYGDQTSKDFIVWMGGVGGNRMEPGVADFGMYQDAFFHGPVCPSSRHA